LPQRRSPSVIEKDIWLFLILPQLFAMPDCKAMAFKPEPFLNGILQFALDVPQLSEHNDLVTTT
jgi:hypothetical protein